MNKQAIESHDCLSAPFMTSNINNALRQRHKDGIWIDEFACHVGNKYYLMDFWATEFGYDKDLIGYEIKASRQDFMRDKKWENYLPFCHSFYFVCPIGLIHPDELPEDVGLIYYKTEKNALRIKKQAVRRKCQIKEKTWKYIMMQLDKRHKGI